MVLVFSREKIVCDGRKLEINFYGGYLEPYFEEEAKGVRSKPMYLFFGQIHEIMECIKGLNLY